MANPCLDVVEFRELDEFHLCKILIIDDDEGSVRLLERVLGTAGYQKLTSTTKSRQAGSLFIDVQPDLVLLDWVMPEMDGYAILKQLHELAGSETYLPIVVLTGDASVKTRERALSAGATDFITKPFNQVETLLRIHNLLQARLSHLIIRADKANLALCVRQRTLELEGALANLKSSQQQNIQQERLAALGAMASGISHDFNNSLSVIIGFSEMLLREAEHGLSKENATRSVTMILTAAEDAAKIVYRLSEFYRHEEADVVRVPIDPNKLIGQAISLTQLRWETEAAQSGRAITVTSVPGKVPMIMGDAAELREALINLIFNAVDALPQGGALVLKTEAEEAAVVIRISDNGVGMSEEVRQRCLEPFFTTKGKAGTGLGLAMVFGIIQRHAGTIAIESEVGKGTTFILRLPAAEQECETESNAKVALSAPLRVLVVDDQPVLCELLCEYLQTDLHLVETAESGREALVKFQAGDFDLVITDYLMAEMTGEQLAKAIKQLRPDVPVMMVTGYPAGSLQGNRFDPAVDLVLDKPLSRAALRHGLEKVLAAR